MKERKSIKSDSVRINLHQKGPDYDRGWMHAFGEGLLDPTEQSFDQWVDFIFNHPVPDPKWESQRIEDAGWAGKPERFLAYATRLFRKPEILPSKYNADQINQGLCIILPGYGLCRWIWEKAIDSTLRTQCVISMVNV